MSHAEKNYVDPRLLVPYDLPDGRHVFIRRGGVALLLADEAESLLKVYGDARDRMGFIWQELEVCVQSLRRGADAIFLSETLTGWLYTRHVCEAAIRVAWAAKDEDSTAITERLQWMAKRDWKLLLDADQAIREATGQGVLAWPDEVRALDVGKVAQMAPSQMRTLASEAGEPYMYAIWRWASALIHPGFSDARPYEKLEPNEVLNSLQGSFAVLTMAAWRVFQKLAPASESPDLTTTWLVLKGGGRVDFDALDKPLPPEEARSELKAP